jgi:hypothetical protein
MRRLTLVIVLAVTAVSFVALRPAATTHANAVEGVWKTVHVTRTDAEGTQENEVTTPNLTIFTATHFAALRAGEREELAEDPADEQLLAAWRPFFASAGTYAVKGNEIHTKIIVHKSPNATAAQRENGAPFELAGDTMYRTFTNPAGTVTWKVKYVRVE